MAHNFLTGMIPTPRYRLLAAAPFRAPITIPAQIANVPSKLDVWGNSTYGDCVTAEEAFAKACYLPAEIFIDAATVVDWARKNGFLNGAMLPDVMNAMAVHGFVVGSQEYRDGPYAGVNYADIPTLQAAITPGNPVKIGIASSCLPSGAGNQSGWYDLSKGRGGSADHCVSLSSYGQAGFLFDALKVSLPSGVSASTDGFLLYTWATQGFVTHDWIMGACSEAWARKPSTVGVPPLPVPPNPVVPDPDWTMV